MTIRADLCNEVLHRMRHGETVEDALDAALDSRIVFWRYWYALGDKAQLLLVQYIEELAAKEVRNGH